VVLQGIIVLIGCVVSNWSRHTHMAVTSYWCSLFLTYTQIRSQWLSPSIIICIKTQSQTFCVPMLLLFIEPSYHVLPKNIQLYTNYTCNYFNEELLWSQHIVSAVKQKVQDAMLLWHFLNVLN
jgi:hypothetical protein